MTASSHSTTSTILATQERLARSFATIVDPTEQRDDQALTLDKQIKASQRRYNEFDELSFELRKDEYAAKCIYEDAGKDEYDKELALRQLVSFEQAVSIEGALVQVAESITALDLIWDQFPQEGASFCVLQDYRRLSRLLFSVLRFLKSESSGNMDEFCEHLGRDPWVSAEEAVSKHRTIVQEIEAERLARMQRRLEREAHAA